MDSDKNRIDEEHRINQHEKVKDQFRDQVHQQMERAATEPKAEDSARVEGLAENMKDKAIREVAETEHDVQKTKTVFRAGQIIDYLFYLAYGLIGMEIILDMMGAHQTSGFKQFVDTISTPLLAPFRGLLYDPGVGPFRLMLSYIFALIFYVFLHFAVKKLLKLFVKTA